MSNKGLLAGILISAAILSCRAEVAAPPAGTPCPYDMVFIDSGGFCMDKYEFPNKAGEAPLRGVNMVEAQRLCATRGKRVPTVEEFQTACNWAKEKDKVLDGRSLESRCRLGLEWSAGPAPAGFYKACDTGGLHDFAGNLWEWAERPGGNDLIYGGAWNSSPQQADCSNPTRLALIVTSPNVGVRCAYSSAIP